MITTIFLILSLVFFGMDACGKAGWSFGTVSLHNIGIGLACFVVALLGGRGLPWKKDG